MPRKSSCIVTHCAPSCVLKTLGDIYKPDMLTNYLSLIRSVATFDHWYFGHYHLDKDIDGEFSCLYNRVVEYAI